MLPKVASATFRGLHIASWEASLCFTWGFLAQLPH